MNMSSSEKVDHHILIPCVIMTIAVSVILCCGLLTACGSSSSPTDSADTQIQEQSSPEDSLEAVFPHEDAERALTVAASNCIAADVFAPDGNTFDPSLFHTYTDGPTSGWYLYIFHDGDCTAIDENTWLVSELEVVEGEDNLDSNRDYILTGNVTFDGTNYVISNLEIRYKTYYSATNVEEGDYPYMLAEGADPLTVSPDMIEA